MSENRPKRMTDNRTTPLRQPEISGHYCTPQVRLERLGTVPFLTGLDREALEKINLKFSAHHFSADEVIYYQGEEAAWLRVVVFGSVRLIHHTESGKDILLDLLRPGEYFGALPMMGTDRYTETAYAHTDCCIMTIGPSAFEEILREYPEVSIRLIGISVRRLEQARETIRQLTVVSVEKRIVTILETLAEKFGEQNQDGLLIQIPLSRKQLADMAGTTPETASRIMSRFQQDGVLRSGRRWVSVIDPERLRELARE